jgi:hypothetical protein
MKADHPDNVESLLYISILYCSLYVGRTPTHDIDMTTSSQPIEAWVKKMREMVRMKKTIVATTKNGQVAHMAWLMK